MKFCKDCIHHRAELGGSRYDSCWHNVQLDTITGEPKPKFCDLERNWYFGKCGESARFFLNQLSKLLQNPLTTSKKQVTI